MNRWRRPPTETFEAAADAKFGKLLWHFQSSENWKASPMTFMAGSKQYVAVAAGPNVLAFALA